MGVSDFIKIGLSWFTGQYSPKPCVYFCGNSLGLQPITTSQYINEDLSRWQVHAVEGHFLSSGPGYPWMTIDETVKVRLTTSLKSLLPFLLATTFPVQSHIEYMFTQ